MGSLAGHISAFLFLVPIGFRRLSWTVTLLLQTPNPSSFRSRPWYFSDHPIPQMRLLRNADLYSLLLALPLGAFSHLFLFFSLSRLPFLLHATVLSLFFLLLLLLLLMHASSSASLVPDDFVFVLGALAFLAEYGLSDDIGEGVEARVRQFTSVVTLTCAAACMVLTLRRSALAADVGLAMGLAIKGTWSLQQGVMLYAVPPTGCHLRKEGFGGLECDLEEHRIRGVAVVELMFAVHAFAVAVGSVGLYWSAARGGGRENRSPEFETIMITRPIMTLDLFEMD